MGQNNEAAALKRKLTTETQITSLLEKNWKNI